VLDAGADKKEKRRCFLRLHKTFRLDSNDARPCAGFAEFDDGAGGSDTGIARDR
jgi:hypothetical protein